MHLIGESFTCLRPGIDFSDALLRATPANSCVLGEPPQHLERVHTPALVNAWQAQLMRCLAQPVEIEHQFGRRRVQVLGEAIFDQDSSGKIDVYLWTWDRNLAPRLELLPAATVVAEGVPYDTLWMNPIGDAAFLALRRRQPGRDIGACRNYVAWIRGQFESTFWGLGTQEIVRRQIAAALALDAEALAIAGRIQTTPHPQVPVRVDAYNQVIGDRRGYATLAQEAPQLIPLYALLAEDLTLYRWGWSRELTASMKTLLRHYGIRTAMWRLLLREGTAWLQPLLEFQDLGRQTLTDAAADVLRVAQAFGAHALAPNWLLRAVLQVGGNPNRPGTDYAGWLSDLFPLCARLGHLLTRADADTAALLQDKAQDIFNWASSHLAKVPARTLRQASVQWLVRQQESQALRDAYAQIGAAPWALPYRITLRDKTIRAVILDSPLAVWEEGQVMRHCAAQFIGACAQELMLLVSLRSGAQTRPLATIGFALIGATVRLHVVSGFANERVSAQIRQSAQRCLMQLRKQRSSLARSGRATQDTATSGAPRLAA